MAGIASFVRDTISHHLRKISKWLRKKNYGTTLQRQIERKFRLRERLCPSSCWREKKKNEEEEEDELPNWSWHKLLTNIEWKKAWAAEVQSASYKPADKEPTKVSRNLTTTMKKLWSEDILLLTSDIVLQKIICYFSDWFYKNHTYSDGSCTLTHLYKEIAIFKQQNMQNQRNN